MHQLGGIGPLLPVVKAIGRMPVDRRIVVEAAIWRYRTGAPWRDVPERFGKLEYDRTEWGAEGVEMRR